MPGDSEDPETVAKYWIREGERDPYLGRWVVDLIYSDGSADDEFEYAIYLDDELAIQWYFRDYSAGKNLPSIRFFPEDFGSILSDVVRLETLSEGLRANKKKRMAIPEVKGGDGRSRKDFQEFRQKESYLRACRRLIAEVLARALEDVGPNSPLVTGAQGNGMPAMTDRRSVAAKGALQNAQDYVNARASDRGRQWVVVGAAGTALACLVLLIVCHAIFHHSPHSAMYPGGLTDGDGDGTSSASYSWCAWMSGSVWHVAKFSLIGGLGGMLSVLMSAYKRNYDAGASIKSLLSEGVIRIMVGVLGATFVTLGVQSGFFMGFLNQASGAGEMTGDMTKLWLMALLGFAAGLSEQLVPSFISIVEAQVQTPK